jgi:hypothetical protein
MRFGIGMNTDHTLEEVGQQFSQSKPLDDPDGPSSQLISRHLQIYVRRFTAALRTIAVTCR